MSAQGPDTRVSAALVLGVLAAVWTWWAWRQGAFFGVVFYPGAIALGAVLLVLLPTAPWRASLRRSRGTAVVLAGLVLIACWTLLSALWSPAPEEALADAQRVLLYALAFALGLWLCNLLGRGVLLSLIPFALAGGVAGLATAVTLATLGAGDDLTRYLEPDGTLDFPIGYRNANAAFFLLALWPALTLAATPRAAWWLRGPMLGFAALCVEIALLAQSRGSILAILPAAFVWLLLSPWRLRALAWLGLALVPAVVALPTLLDVYQTTQDLLGEPSLPSLQDAGRAMLVTTAIGIAVGSAAAFLDRAPRRSPDVEGSLARATAAGTAVVVVGVCAVFVATGTDPVDFVGQRTDELSRARNPDLAGQQTRFSVNAQSLRTDVWRVAWDEAREDPLIGNGAGAFQYSYTRERTIDETVLDAHSVELELASELGFPIVAVFVVVVGGAIVAVVRSRRVGVEAASLSAAGLAAGAYWLVHASIDWFWTYPGLTAPVFGLLGAAAAPAVLGPRNYRNRYGRLAVAFAVIAAVVVAIPLYLSERYTDDAYRGWGTDLDRAYSDLARARDLNPLSEEPLLAEGGIAEEAGDRERAVTAFRDATDHRPEEWAAHYFLGRLLIGEDRRAAIRELTIASTLNPRDTGVRRALERARERASD